MNTSKRITLFYLIITITFSLPGSQNTIADMDELNHSSIDFMNIRGEITNNQIKADFTYDNLETFFDDYVPSQLTRRGVAGLTLSIVEGNDVVFTEGYGYADLNEALQVDSGETLFRIGSISKTFTATAVLQLVENGSLELDADVNDYLSQFQIPDTFEEPITLRHLLTHTAGFEEISSYNPIIVFNITELPDFHSYMEEILPERVHSPGEVPSYSNYGYSLVGLIVESVGGKPFYEYIEENILSPLNMSFSTFEQPLPEELLPYMSKSYYQEYEEYPFEYVTIPPAGSMVSTAEDMANFMIAHLNDGIFNNTHIFSNETAELMHQKHFSCRSDMPGIYLGFYDMRNYDFPVMGHGGDTVFFHSQMALFPESKVGIFISTNSYNGRYATDELLNEFIAEFLNTSYYKQILPVSDHKTRVEQFEGFYVHTRRVYATDESMMYKDTAIEFKATTNGTLSLVGTSIEFVETQPNFFEESTGMYKIQLFFKFDTEGNIEYLFTSLSHPIIAFERLHPIYQYQNWDILYSLFISITVLLGSVLVIWGMQWMSIVKNKETRKEQLSPRFRAVKWSIFLTMVLSSFVFFFTQSHFYSKLRLEYEQVSILNVISLLSICVLILISFSLCMSVIILFIKKERNSDGKWIKWNGIFHTFVVFISTSLVPLIIIGGLLTI